MRTLLLGIVLTLLLPCGGWAENLTLTLASQALDANILSTASSQSVSLTVQPGQTVSFARQSGRDYRLQAGGGFYWTQVQELPRDAEFIAITALEQSDTQLELAVEVSHKQGTRLQQYSSTISAEFGEWVQLYGPAQNQIAASGTVYGTQQGVQESLFLRVTAMAAANIPGR